jgi:hypothetical protein
MRVTAVLTCKNLSSHAAELAPWTCFEVGPRVGELATKMAFTGMLLYICNMIQPSKWYLINTSPL